MSKNSKWRGLVPPTYMPRRINKSGFSTRNCLLSKPTSQAELVERFASHKASEDKKSEFIRFTRSTFIDLQSNEN